jgi:Domain of Unknown Function (DUF928)
MKLVHYLLMTLSLTGILSAQQPQPSSQQVQPPPQAQSEELRPKRTSAPTNNKRARVVTNLSGFDLLEDKKLSSETIVVGATRDKSPPVALAPRLGKLYGANPTFSWSYDGVATKFVFVLSDDAQSEVFRAEVNGTQVRYPAGAPALQPGKIYFWTVITPGGPLVSTSSAPSGVSVVSAVQRKEIETKLAQFPGNSYEDGMARAQVLTDYRLWYDVLAAFTEMIERYPDRAELFERRATIYAQLPSTRALAESDFSRAEKAQIEKQ